MKLLLTEVSILRKQDALSTASPLPLQPLPPSHLSEEEARALKREVANRLLEHRQRRGRSSADEAASQQQTPAPRHRVADQVAARFARSVSYSDFLKQEAETAIRQAEAAAEVARRNAEAVAAAQQQLLDEIEQWNAPVVEAEAAGPAEVISFAAPVETASPLAASEMTAPLFQAPMAAAVSAPEPPAAAEHPSVEPAATPDFAEMFTAAVNEIAERPTTLAERLGLATGPLEVAEPLPTNLIEFPRQLVAARKVRPRLAEGPLRDEQDAAPERAQLRIFEVEAASVSTQPMSDSVLPEWHTIRLDANAQVRTVEHPDAQISFALPLYVAPIHQRMMAFAVDACCVLTTFLAAVALAAYVSPVLPTGLMAAAAAAITLLTFAIGYQLLFFTLNDSTPGMRYARIGFCTFHDENPTRSALRHRIFALLLAGMPLGLGILWATMDEEKLGWHDRISRMYPRGY